MSLLVLVVLVVGGFVGGSMWLDATGVPTRARVRMKTEDIRISSDADWMRVFRLGVEYASPATYRAYASVAVDSARYDRLRVGDSVTIRRLRCCASLARLADRSTGTLVREMVGPIVWDLRWVLWLVAGLAVLVLAMARGRLAVLVAASAWIAAGLALHRAAASPVTAGTYVTMARVHQVRAITAAFEGRRSSGFGLPRPFVVAALAFVPAPGRDTVVAVDEVDARSVPKLTADSLVSVRFDPTAPRAARLVLGTRTFGTRDTPVYVAGLGAVVVLATLFALAAAWPTRRDALPSRR